jgi:hypothetical protein
MKARLSWSEGAPSEQGTGFKVYRSENGGSFTLRATLPLSTTTYDDPIQPGVLYVYQVCEYLSLSGGDVLSSYAQITLFVVQRSDAGTCSDRTSLKSTIQRLDTGACLDRASLKSTIQRLDTGACSDRTSLKSNIQALDTGACSDRTSLKSTIQHLDTGACLDRASLKSTIERLDTGACLDRASVSFSSQRLDSGICSESAGTTSSIQYSDSGACSEEASASPLILQKQDIDAGSGLDQISLFSSAYLDTGQGSESAFGVASVEEQEYGGLEDLASVGSFL